MIGPGARLAISGSALALMAGTLSLASATAAPAPQADRADPVALRKIGSFDQPVFVSAPKAETHRVYVVEKPGRIVVVRDGQRLRTPFLNIASRVSDDGERGLLSMAFAPDYARSRKFYVDYTDNNGDTRIVEFRRNRKNADRAVRGSARTVLTVHQPYPNHNGGQIQFGPDGHLYIGMGDGGSANDPQNRAQNLRSPLGKMLRIDPEKSKGRAYSVPSSNPFVGRNRARSEIFSYGWRNPWRFSFDRLNGDFTAGDVGQDAWEEIDYAARGTRSGANYGWRVFEGDHRANRGTASGAVAPVIERSHGDGWCAITGGYVVRDSSVPALYGRYVYGDLCRSSIRSVKLAPGGATGDRATGLKVSSLVSFGEDGLGRVYAVSIAGPVYRITG